MASATSSEPFERTAWSTASKPIEPIAADVSDTSQPFGVKMAKSRGRNGHRAPRFDMYGRQLAAGRGGDGKKKRSGIVGKLDHGAIVAGLPQSVLDARMRPESLAQAAGIGKAPLSVLATISPAKMTRSGHHDIDSGTEPAAVRGDASPQAPRYYNTAGRALMPAGWAKTPEHKTRSELVEQRRLKELPDISYDIDGDGVVSGLDYFIARQFDTNKNGSLSPEERVKAWNKLQSGYSDRFYVARGSASSLATRVQHDADGNIMASDVQGGKMSDHAGEQGANAGIASRHITVAPYATAGTGGALAAAEDEPEYARQRSIAATIGARSRNQMFKARRVRDAVKLDDTFGGGVQIRGAVRARRLQADMAAAQADQANQSAAVAAAKRAVRMRAGEQGATANEARAGGGGGDPRQNRARVDAMAATAVQRATAELQDATTTIPGMVTDSGRRHVDTDGDGILDMAVRAAKEVRRPILPPAATRSEKMLQAVDAVEAAERDLSGSLRELQMRATMRVSSGGGGGAANMNDNDDAESVVERAKPYSDPTRTDRANYASRRRMMRERHKETTRAALQATHVREEEFGMDERESPRSEDGEFWEFGGRALRTGGVSIKSKTLRQMKARRQVAKLADGDRFAMPGSLGIHSKPLPKFADTVGVEGKGWFESGPARTAVQTPWDGSELDGTVSAASLRPATAAVTSLRGRRVDSGTMKPLVRDGLRREGDDHRMVTADPFKTRTIRHDERPSVRRRRDAALADKPTSIDHWQSWRNTAGGASGSGPIDTSTKRFTTQRFTTGVLEHRMAEERASGDPLLGDDGKERFINPADTKPLYSSFSTNGQFRERKLPSVEAVLRNAPKSPLQRRRSERTLAEESKGPGGSPAVANLRHSVRRKQQRHRMKRRGSLTGSGALLAKDDDADLIHTRTGTGNGIGNGMGRVTSASFADGNSPPAWQRSGGFAVSGSRSAAILPSRQAANATPVVHTPGLSSGRVSGGGSRQTAEHHGGGRTNMGESASAAILPRHDGTLWGHGDDEEDDSVMGSRQWDPAATESTVDAFAAIGDAAREFAERHKPQLRRQRLWAEANSRRQRSATALGRSRGARGAATTASAPVLPAVSRQGVRHAGVVQSSGLPLLHGD